jgi:hypothetical protein
MVASDTLRGTVFGPPSPTIVHRRLLSSVIVRHRPPSSAVVRYRPPSSAIVHNRPASSAIVRHRSSVIVHNRPPWSPSLGCPRKIWVCHIITCVSQYIILCTIPTQNNTMQYDTIVYYTMIPRGRPPRGNAPRDRSLRGRFPRGGTNVLLVLYMCVYTFAHMWCELKNQRKRKTKSAALD